MICLSYMKQMAVNRGISICWMIKGFLHKGSRQEKSIYDENKP
ncbi:hypothetical protein CHCC14820_1952 [Bacillus paralicheniformis]|nr:hypothetical protein B4123_0573 [Bacillus paralicheniformis]TWJ54207.1 hypothetical protein CHCC5023_2270 [Bacillus paralicheniformis]TWJ61562.1 hypothetical protein CHCC5021_4004 [Bacillus paralicheniformis]TWJ79723.1 hypothetical protein CHCC5019_3440 [Bacillus paralicheniformis]TWK42299.1 hypothetical protein CHCC20347_2413 [Bacillus paralicheniformis]